MTSDDGSGSATNSTTSTAWFRRQTLATKRLVAWNAGWLASASLVLVVVLFVAGLAWLWFEVRDGAAHRAELEKRIVDLTAQEGERDDTATAVMHAARRLDAVQTDLVNSVQRIDRLEEGLRDAAPARDANSDTPHPDATDRRQPRQIELLRQEVATLHEMLDTLSRDQGAAFVIAVGRLRDAVEGGRPFVAELEAVAVLGADDPDIGADVGILARHARGGVTTHRALEESLGHVLTAAGNASRLAAASGLLEETLAHIQSLVTVRRIDGETADSESTTTIRRIETAVAAGKLEEALREIEFLPPDFSSPSMTQWVATARARIEADGALDRLHARAIFSVVQP